MESKAIQPSLESAAMPDSAPVIQLVGVGKTFGSGDTAVKALSDIDLDIHKGDIFGIIGMSGAGKSTLIRCINLLERPTSGRVLFNGKDLAGLPVDQLRKTRQSMGMIFQQFNLLMQRTAEANVRFPLELTGMGKKEAKERAMELLAEVGLKEKANAYPSQLSGGQKQRVAIARALATNPEVLLCDEATSALDPTTTRSILALLKEINQRHGITIIIITHEMSVIEEICSHVAIIDESRIAEVGRVDEIFKRPKTVAAQKLVYPDGQKFEQPIGTKALRIVFDGSSSFEPVVSSMILDCKTKVNIMFADMQNIDGTAYGQMVIQLPEDKETADKIRNYLETRGLSVEEVMDDVG